MKRTATLLSLLFLLCFASARAQQVSISYSSESGVNCPTPASYGLYVQGETTGYLPGDSVDLFVDYGDGNTGTLTTPMWFNPPYPAYFGANFSHTYMLPGFYTVTYIATGPNGAADTLTSTVMIAGTCNNITGKVYVDMNSDCAYNTGDAALQSMSVQLLYNGELVAYGYTDASGNYQISALTGYSYELTFQNQSLPNFAYSCGSADTMSLTLSTTATMNFVVADANTVTVAYAGDTLGPFYCPSPAPVTFMVSGQMTGYPVNDSMEVYVNFGDSQDTTFNVAQWSNGYWTSIWATITHTYSAPGNYNLMYVITGPDGTSDTLIVPNDVIVSDSCGNIAGKIYLDANSNCTYDQGESLVAGYYVYAQLPNGSYQPTYTNINGEYFFNLPLGSATVNIPTTNIYGYMPDCPASGSQSVTVTTGTTYADFSLTCNTTGFDLSAGLSGWGFRPGQPAYLHAWYSNISCTPVSGTVTITLDPQTNYVGMCDTTNLPTVVSNTLSWSFSNLSITGYWYWWNSVINCIQLTTDSTAQIGDTVCFTITITPTTGDLDPSNNTETVCYEVRNSWDPNMKQVSPEGLGSTGNVAPNTTFTYTIHFQNMGNAPALDITVMDTLDADLDITSLQILGSSHFMQPDVIGSDVLRFHYPGINLPDSASNEPASHGWVQYRIKAKPNLANFTPIENTAHIYFDLNPAVVTNTTLNTIDYGLGIVNPIVRASVIAFPNPADEQVQLHFEQAFEGSLQLVDMLGRVVLTQHIPGSRAAIIDVKKLADGMYTLVLNGEQATMTKKFLVSHR